MPAGSPPSFIRFAVDPHDVYLAGRACVPLCAKRHEARKPMDTTPAFRHRKRAEINGDGLDPIRPTFVVDSRRAFTERHAFPLKRKGGTGRPTAS